LDLERIIDDFIFLCFLVGNDFLPHIPALRITEGGIDCLMILYMQTVPKAQDYLTNCGSINLPVLDVFLQMLGVVEEHLLRGQQKKMDIIKQRN
jgi:5'-3' exoribonuclease 2